MLIDLRWCTLNSYCQLLLISLRWCALNSYCQLLLIDLRWCSLNNYTNCCLFVHAGTLTVTIVRVPVMLPTVAY